MPTPTPGPGEVLLRVLRIGLRADPEKGGIVAHGIAGEVAQVGPGVEDYRPGERYAVQSILGCGDCDYCYSARENLCPQGYHTHGFGGAGAYAELFLVPPLALEQGCLLHMPDGVDPDAAVFVEPLAYCMNGLNHLPISSSARLVILGAGITGILCAIIAQYRNVRRVTLFDHDPKRIEVLRGLGLPFESVLAGGEDAVAKILADSPGGVEAVVTTLPDPASVRRAFALTAIGGNVCFMVPVTAAAGGSGFEPSAITRRELHVHGASGASRNDYIEARHMVAEDVVPAARLISHRFPIGELKSAIDVLSDHASRPLAVLLEVPSQTPPPAVAPHLEPREILLERREPEQEIVIQHFEVPDEVVSEMARRVREPQFNYGPGSDLGPSGEITPWPDLPADYVRDRDRQKRFRRDRDRDRDRGRGRSRGGRREREGRARPVVPHAAPAGGPPGKAQPAEARGAEGRGAEGRGGEGRGDERRGRRRRGGRGRGRREERREGVREPLPAGAPEEQVRPGVPDSIPEDWTAAAEPQRQETAERPVQSELFERPPAPVAREAEPSAPPAEPAAPREPAARERAPARKPRPRGKPAGAEKREKGERPSPKRGVRGGRGGGRGEGRVEKPAGGRTGGGRSRGGRRPPAKEAKDSPPPPAQPPPADPLASWPRFWEDDERPGNK
jgi:L-iditol 2-dehydrogenase